MTVQQNPSLSSGLHETSRLSFQPSAAYAEHGTSNSTLTSNFQSPQFQMAHFQVSRVERRGSEDGPHLEATFLHAQKHLFETSPNQSTRQTCLTYTPDPSQLPQLQIPQTCQTVNAGYSNTHHFLQFQPPHMAFSHETRGSTFSTTCNTSFDQQTTQSNEQWHSGMSPFPYEILLLPNNVRKCYGCGNDFAEKYRKPPFNLIVKHVDRRIIKKCEQTGRLVFSHDYTVARKGQHCQQIEYHKQEQFVTNRMRFAANIYPKRCKQNTKHASYNQNAILHCKQNI